MVGDKARIDPAAVSRRFTGFKKAQILDEKWHTRERPLRQPGRERPVCLCVLLVNDGIDRRIDLLRPGDRHFEHRFGAEFAFGD